MKIYQRITIIVFITLIIACQTHKEKVFRIKTNVGDIRLKLYNETPIHRDNFVKLVKEGYYNGLLFHRIIPNFMIQTGDDMSRNAKKGVSLGHGGKEYELDAEILPQFYHKRGVLAAARQGDNINPKRKSSGSQFYLVVGEIFSSEKLDELVVKINNSRKGKDSLGLSDKQKKDYTTIGGCPHLDGMYTVFGEIIGGMKVVEKISKYRRDERNRPYKDIRIEIITEE